MHRDRYEIWRSIISENAARSVLEVGVWEGDFSSRMLSNCPSIARYYMLDAWRPLANWNKPLNLPASEMEAAHKRALAAVSFAAERVTVLRGTTEEVIERIPDNSLDLAYVDGDHTARGIMIDLQMVWPKVRPGGILGGDDFRPNAWQHDERYEPTLIFPLAVYFAEAVRAEITALPFDQFSMRKPDGPGKFKFTDETGRYGDLSVRTAIQRPHRRSLYSRVMNRLSSLGRFPRREGPTSQ